MLVSLFLFLFNYCIFFLGFFLFLDSLFFLDGNNVCDLLFFLIFLFKMIFGDFMLFVMLVLFLWFLMIFLFMFMEGNCVVKDLYLIMIIKSEIFLLKFNMKKSIY